MDVRSVLEGVAAGDDLLGDSRVCVAVLDGPVDLSHPCFVGADVTRLNTLVQESAGPGLMSLHGTHVASLLFGQGSPVTGMVPRCRALVAPIFRDTAEGRVPQLDLARAIEQAVEQGAHIINISGGQRTSDGQSESMLERALQMCDNNGVLVVSAVGNDGCDCLQTPAATQSVLAVGASGTDGEPLEMNNWGKAYRSNGVIAPGQDIEGAAPGGGVRALTGSSFATPAVAGVAALLVSAQLRQGRQPDPKAAGQAILNTAGVPACFPEETPHCRRHLVGRLDASRAYDLITGSGARDSPAALKSEPAAAVVQAQEPVAAGRHPHDGEDRDQEREGAHAMETNRLNFGSPQETDLACQCARAAENTPPGSPGGEDGLRSVAPACGCSDAGAGNEAQGRQDPAVRPTASSEATPAQEATGGRVVSGAVASSPLSPEPVGGIPSLHESGVRAAHGHEPGNATAPLVYAIGKINFDFGTEARRDAFRQLMGFSVAPRPDEEGRPVYTEANPYDVKQMREYLSANPWAGDKLIWTLEVSRTPIYALKAEPAFGMDWGGPVEDQPLRPSSDAPQRPSEGFYPPVSRVYKLFRDAILLQTSEQPLTGPVHGLAAAQQGAGGKPAKKAQKGKEEGDTGKPAEEAPQEYVSRVSIPGVLTGKTVRLFSGQTVPELEVDARGVAMWNETLLINTVVETIKARGEEVKVGDEQLRMTLRTLLDKFYNQFQNLGQTSADRALNYIGTNAYTVAQTVAEGILSASYVPGVPNTHAYTVDTVTVRKSSFERMGSDCQDVHVRFMDPENELRAKVTYVFTVDVNYVIPITLGPVNRFLGDV